MKFNQLYNLIIEANINSLISLFQTDYLFKIHKHNYNELTDKEKLDLQSYIENQKELYSNYVSSITINTQYQSWVFELLKSKSLIFPEDIEKTKEVILNFDKIKKSENFKDSKNILDYNSFGDLHKVVYEFINKNKSSVTLNLGDNKVIYDKDNFKIVILDNYEKALPYIKDTGWCVKYKDNWNEYIKNYKDPIYYMILKDDKQYALIHFGSEQVKDVHDSRFKLEDVTIEFYNAVNWLIEFKHINRSKLFNDFVPILINYSDDEYKLAAVNENGFIIKFIKNPSKEEQLAAVRNNGGAIQYIKNPDIEVQLATVKRDGHAIQYIKNPDIEVQLAAVNKNGFLIDYIKNPTKEIKLAAVKQNGYAIEGIKNPSKEVQLTAVKQDGYTIQYIKNPSKEVQLAAVKENRNVMQYIKNPDPEVIKYYKEHYK